MVDMNPRPAEGIPCTDELPLSRTTPVTKTLLENYLRQNAVPPCCCTSAYGNGWGVMWVLTAYICTSARASGYKPLPPPPQHACILLHMCINNNYIGSRLDAFYIFSSWAPLTLINPRLIGLVSKPFETQLFVMKPNFLCSIFIRVKTRIRGSVLVWKASGLH